MPQSAIDLGVAARFRAASRSERSAIFQEIFQAHRDQVFRLCSLHLLRAAIQNREKAASSVETARTSG